MEKYRKEASMDSFWNRHPRLTWVLLVGEALAFASILAYVGWLGVQPPPPPPPAPPT